MLECHRKGFDSGCKTQSVGRCNDMGIPLRSHTKFGEREKVPSQILRNPETVKVAKFDRNPLPPRVNRLHRLFEIK